MIDDSWTDGPARGDARHHVLLVDDNDLVRRLLVRMLDDAGYAVTEAASGTEAIELLSDPDLTVDALLSDLLLPDRPGGEVAEAARRARPGLPVIYVSGYDAEAMVGNGSCPGDAYLAKPFTDAQLRATLGGVLSASGAQG